MALEDYKVPDWQKPVKKLDDKPKISADELKAWFDSNSEEVKAKYNALLDALKEAWAAGEIGAAPFEGASGATIQAQLEEVQKNLVGHPAKEIPSEAFEGVDAETVQGALESIQRNLESYISKIKSAAGAAQIGVAAYPGVPEGTAQAALESLAGQIKDVTAGMIPDYGVTWIKLAKDIAEAIEAISPSRASSALDDYTMETGRFENAGEGWNTFRFRQSFDESPVLTVTPVDFSGWCEVKDVTKDGFLYCLRKLGLATGEAASESVYVATGTGASPGHTEKTVVTGVTFPEYRAETTADKITIHYTAIEYGGDL